MKRWLWVTVMTGFIVALLGLITVAVVAAVSPFDPGDGWFYRSQRSLEETVVGLYNNPTGQAQQRIELAGRRLHAVERLSGSPYENASFAELEQAVRTAVQAVSICPQTDAVALRANLMALFGNIGRVIPANASNTDEFQRWMAAVTQRLNQNDFQLAELIIFPNEPSSAAGNQIILPEPAPTQPARTAIRIDPHIVYFQPGSPGAMHVFYPLLGRHVDLQCTDCHPLGEFAGTGNLCESCHLVQKPTSHFPGTCEQCHAPTAWADIHFQHTAAFANDCTACHLTNLPANHYPGQCSACHNTLAWIPATFDHTAAGATDCSACHLAKMPANHYPGQCSACHNTSAWLPATFDHSVAGATDCVSCHIGNRPANHYTGQCSMCHSTNAWTPASFNHTFPTNHGGANGQCSKCHPSGTGAWTCFTCHNQNEMDKKHNEKGIANYASRCLECHAGGRNNDD